VSLQVAQASSEITVTENTAEVHTTDTQIGQTIESKQIVDIPLNGRSYTDLLAVQAGLSPVTTSGAGNTSSGGGFGTVPAAGETNTGQFSILGQRESDNAYYLNGASVQETIGQQAGIIPNLDSIAEFRILSSNVDAEYGSFTGGIINVATKSGTNAFHGGLFEFLRNTHLDARNYFSPERAVFHQNQYGGTFGGPIRKDKIFFFVDYQFSLAQVNSTYDLYDSVSRTARSHTHKNWRTLHLVQRQTGTQPRCQRNLLVLRLRKPDDRQ